MIKTTIVGFGDSLTSGYGVLTGDNYLDRLEQYLPKYYPSIYWKIHNISKSSITTREGLELLSDKVLPLKPNIVLILLGTNDSALNPELNRALDEFEDNFKEMICLLLDTSNNTGLNYCIPIPVLITPPCVIEHITSPIRTNNRIHQYSHIIKKISKQYNCPLIDFFSITNDFIDKEKLFLKDGIHLSKKGYDLLYDSIFGEFTKLINYEGLLRDREMHI
ncbi:MAG: SGNH/GDSL hydrolase family protein [Eubacteriales bacterium]